METKDSLQVVIDEFIDQRIEESYEKILHTEQYKQLLRKYNQLSEKFEANMNDVKFIDDYREAEADIYSPQIKEAYKQGFKDSMIIFVCEKMEI